jgi:hypothetical protein
MKPICKLVIIFVFLIHSSNLLFGQDTITYKGTIKGILIETIELYSDNTFKWTSEYDLSWSEYGLYKTVSNTLQLKYYLKFNRPQTMSLKDSIMRIGKPFKIENLKIGENALVRLNEKNKEIHRIREKSIRNFWSWLFGHKYELRKITAANIRYSQQAGEVVRGNLQYGSSRSAG